MMNMAISTEPKQMEQNPLAVMQQTRNITQPKSNDEYGHIYQTKPYGKKFFGNKS